MEENAGKCSQICFHLLPFISENRDFSKVTGKGNKKISSMLWLAWRVVVATFQTAPASRLAPSGTVIPIDTIL
jgi:hypothetical protein